MKFSMINDQGSTKNVLSSWFIVHSFESGQALITIMFFMVFAITIISAAAAVIFADNLSATTSQEGMAAYYAAESGAEDGVLNALRNRSSVAPYSLLPAGSNPQATITITFNTPTNATITSVGKVDNVDGGDAVKEIKVQTTILSTGQFTISSWKEITTN